MTELALLAGPGLLPSDIPTPTLFRPWMDGVQAIWRFGNDYGASVIRMTGSYGAELAVIRFTGADVEEYELDHDTPITNDVIGYMPDVGVLVGLLRAIRDLPSLHAELPE